MLDRDLTKGLAREDLARFLAACYYQPGPELAEEEVCASIVQAAALIDPELEQIAERLRAAFETISPDELLLDYSRLFLGPFEIPAKPYGSVWLEGEKVAMGSSTVAVRELYRQGGFEMADDFPELPDHVAVELEFLYLLTFRENEGRRAGDAQALRDIGEQKSRFLREHLGEWIGAFAEAVRKSAGTEFYRQLAALTEAFILAEKEAAESSC